MLNQLNGEDDLSVDYFKSILDSVRVEGLFNTTLYSNIFDLVNGRIYLYHWHQFDEVVALNVDEELAKDHYVIRIKDLFSQETVESATREYRWYNFLMYFSIIGVIALIIGLIIFLKKSKLKTTGGNNN